MAVSSKVRLWWQSTVTSGTVNGEWMYLEFADWCKFTVEYNVPAKSITDRYGIVHRIIPTTLAKKLRWPISATVTPRHEDLLEGSDLTLAIQTADAGTNKFTLPNGEDYRAQFPVGRTFTVSGSTGNDGTYTVVGVTGVPTVIEVANVPDGANNGNVVNSFALPEVLDWWAIGNAFFADTLFYIYHYEDGVDDDGGAVARRQAYKAYFSQIPRDIMGTLVFIDGETPDMRMEFIVTEDGTFDTFTNDPSSSYTINPTSRPT